MNNLSAPSDSGGDVGPTAGEESGESLENVFADVACTVCGCVCDDLQMRVVGDQIVEARGACSLAEAFLLHRRFNRSPAAWIDGQTAELSTALDRAAELLDHARAPLIYGLSRSSTPGQRAAVALADYLGATIDTTASRCHAPSIIALQEVGESTASLGEIRHRADLVIYWGSDPVESHPRHLERYALWPAGDFVPDGREGRTLAVVDVRPSATSTLADLFVQVEPGSDFDVIWRLRGMIRGLLPIDEPPAGQAPAESELDRSLRRLAQAMKSCRCGVVFFGLGLTRAPLGHLAVTALLELVRELNDITRFHAKRMRVYGDVAGADSVLCWQTGYPFSVNLARGYPRYNPGEYSANEVLQRREADCCLLVGSEGTPHLSTEARAHLGSIPTIALDYPALRSPHAPDPVRADVRITTGIYGIHAPGTAYRMDEVPIPLRTIMPSPYPTDADVLQAVEQRLRVRRGSGSPASD